MLCTCVGTSRTSEPWQAKCSVLCSRLKRLSTGMDHPAVLFVRPLPGQRRKILKSRAAVCWDLEITGSQSFSKEKSKQLPYTSTTVRYGCHQLPRPRLKTSHSLAFLSLIQHLSLSVPMVLSPLACLHLGLNNFAYCFNFAWLGGSGHTSAYSIELPEDVASRTYYHNI